MNDFYNYNPSETIAARERTVFGRVFLWMAIALACTGTTALFTVNTPALLKLIVGNPIIFFGLFIVEILLVGAISRGMATMTAQAMTLSLVVYSILNGLTFSVYFLIYTHGSIASIFFIAAAMFGCAFMVGQNTRIDLSQYQGFLMMALIGLILATVVNIFMHNTGLQMVLSYVGILIFAGLTAYDSQKIKRIAAMNVDEEGLQKLVIYGTLSLYLDFINIFIMLLRLFGKRR